MINHPKVTLAIALCIGAFSPLFAQPIAQWSFTARIDSARGVGPISLPFAARVGDTISGTITFDYSDPGAPYGAPFIRRYTNQPPNLLTASVNGVPIAEAASSFRHDVEVWNNSEFHNGGDLLFINYQTASDARLPGFEISMGISGGEQTGLSVSNLNLPSSLRPGDFGGLSFGLFINNRDLSATYDLSARVTSILPFGTVLDTDHDGVADESDRCPGTALDAIVDEHGCSLDQLVPCGGAWKNHGQYLVAYGQAAQRFYLSGRITAAQLDALLRAAAHSPCGRR